MKRVIEYDLETGEWWTRLASDEANLSSGELDDDVILCDITGWSDERLAAFERQDMESQIFDLEQLEFMVWSRRET